MSVRQYDDAIVEFRRGLSIRQDDVTALNLMGYAAAYSGDLPTAIRVLRGYEKLRPNEPNPLDSLGDAHFALGHFKEAEQFYLAAGAKAPRLLSGGEVLKAAQARLMTGDVAGATGLFKRYLAARESIRDPNAGYQAACWEWVTGQRRQALASIDRVARANEVGPLREISGRADAQAAIWLLTLGDSAGATDHARKAAGEAGPATAPLIAIVAYLALPDVYPQPAPEPMRDYAQAYSLLLHRQFRPAAAVLQGLYQKPSGELDDGLAVLLAWAYAETGDWRRAEPLLRLTPLPQASGFPVFEPFYFPRLLSLRAAVLERTGQRGQAESYHRLHRMLEGRP
jgi:tetratricopeptide (TPR) repeat protein